MVNEVGVFVNVRVAVNLRIERYQMLVKVSPFLTPRYIIV